MLRLVALVAVPLFLAGCGSDGDTTIIQSTTTVVTETEAATSTAETPTTTGDSTAGPSEEFTGRCTGHQPPLVPEPGKPGFTDVRVVEASCDYATEVATEFVSDYGPNCFSGCTRTIENIPCRTVGPAHAEVICSAARTEVRFSIEGSN